MVKLYQVGGSVRDAFLGLNKPKDIDYAVEASSYQEMKEYIQTQGEIFLEQEKYLTIRAKINNECADFVLCRKDSTYTDGRRPDHVYPGTIYDDLARRDFTINAIAIDEQGNILDPHNGLKDIDHRRIKCVGNTEERFNEDGIRILRAIRFSITKEFDLSDDINNFLNKTPIRHLEDKYLLNVSEERIKDELFKCFQYNTMRTLYCLNKYYALNQYCFLCTKLWLKPTLEKR